MSSLYKLFDCVTNTRNYRCFRQEQDHMRESVILPPHERSHNEQLTNLFKHSVWSYSKHHAVLITSDNKTE